MEIVSYSDAVQAGRTWYFTGKPCKNGHIAKRYISGACQECLTEKTKDYRAGAERVSHNAVAGVPYEIRSIYYKAKNRAKQAAIPFTLSFDDFVEIVRRADGRCELTGITFNDSATGARVRPFMPSLDRVDSASGYVPGNCRLVCAAVNMALNDFGEAVFNVLAFAYCRAKESKLVGAQGLEPWTR